MVLTHRWDRHQLWLPGAAACGRHRWRVTVMVQEARNSEQRWCTVLQETGQRRLLGVLWELQPGGEVSSDQGYKYRKNDLGRGRRPTQSGRVGSVACCGRRTRSSSVDSCQVDPGVMFGGHGRLWVPGSDLVVSPSGLCTGRCGYSLHWGGHDSVGHWSEPSVAWCLW